MPNLTSELIVKLVDDVTGPAKTVGEAMKKVESQIKEIDNAFKNSGASSKFQQQLQSLGRSTGDIDRVASAWKQYASSVGAASESSMNWTKEQTTAIKSWENQTIRSLRQVEAQEKSYQKQQQQLAAASQRQAEQRVLSAERTGERHGVGHMIRNGVLAYTGAHAVFHAGKSVIEQGADLAHQLSALQAAHQPTPEEMEDIKKTARESAKAVPTSTYADNLKVINETIGAFGSVKEALEHLQFNQKVASYVHSQAGDKIDADAGKMGFQMGKFGEMRRSTMDPARYEREMGKMAQAMIFTGGNFNPQEMYELGQQSGQALPNLSERFMTRILPSIASERGGAVTGSGLNAWENVIMGKARDEKQAEEWMRLGLLDKSKVDLSSKGAVKSWSAGAVKDTRLAQSDPLEWAEKTLLPAMQAKGIDIHDKEAVSQELGTLFRNSRSNTFANDLAQELSRNRLHKDEALMDKTMGVEQGYKFNLENDPTQALKTISAAVTDFGQALSAPALQQVAPLLTGLAGGIKSIAQVAQDHPKLAAGAGITAGAVGLGGSAWFASQMAGGFGLRTSATALDGSAAALTRAAAALAAGGGGLPGSEIPGGERPGKVGAGRRLFRAGKAVAGAAIPVVGGTMAAYDYLTDPDRIKAAEGHKDDNWEWKDTKDKLYRQQIADQVNAPGYQPIGTSGSEVFSPKGPDWSANQPSAPWPRQLTGSTGATASTAEPPPQFINPTTGALDISGQAGQAGAAAGEAYQAGLIERLQATYTAVQGIVQQIAGALDFSATPRIEGTTSQAAPQRSSLTNYDHGKASSGGGVTIGQ